jgi:hypothetical protein
MSDLFLELGRLDDPAALRREAELAVSKLSAPHEAPVRALMEAVAGVCKAENSRRSGPGVNRFPLRLSWSLPDGMPADVDQSLDITISFVAVMFNAERRGSVGRSIRDAWHSLAVQLTELRDQRKAERRIFDRLRAVEGGYRGGYGFGPDDPEAADDAA